MESYLLILTTFNSKKEAETMMQELLTSRLIACANIIQGVDSWFLWNGKVTHENEALVVIKSRKKYYRHIEEYIRAHHSYKVPEIIALPMLYASAEYLDWMHEETSMADINE